MALGLSLHVGLNAIDPKHYGQNGALAGCENDARDMRAIAKSCGFESQILLTKEATASRFLKAIDDAARKLGSGDTFLLTLACHGSQVPDAGSDPNDDEPDGYDETWLLYDRMIIDDEAYVAFQKFAPGVRIVVISDSCHSGSATRKLLRLHEDLPRALRPTGRPRCIPYGELKECYLENMSLYKSLQSGVGRGRRSGMDGPTVLLISGCQDNQTSSDGSQNGFFTENLKAVWGKGYAGSYEKFWKAIGKSMDTPLQVPNLFVYGAEPDTLMGAKVFDIGARQHQIENERTADGHVVGNGMGRFVVQVPLDKIELAVSSPAKWEAFVEKTCTGAIVEAGEALASAIQNQRTVRLRNGARGEAHVSCSVDKGGAKCEGGVSWKF